MLWLFIGSDIHRRLDHLEKALADARSEAAIDAILIAGDLQVTQEDLEAMAIPEPVYLVHGNNDALLEPAHPADELVIDIEDGRIAHTASAGFRCQLPQKPEAASHRILMTHGHMYHSPRLLELRARALEGDADIVVYGHTHRYQKDVGKPGDALILNPGTLMPPYGSGRCTYLILEIEGPHIMASRREL